jgi:hypothetical protein
VDESTEQVVAVEVISRDPRERRSAARDTLKRSIAQSDD